MSKKQKIKIREKNISINKIKNIKRHYAFFRANETIQLSKDFDNVVVVKGDDVLLPIGIFNKKTFTFMSTIDNIISPLGKNTTLHNKKLLIIRYGGIGDIISSLFAISELKNKFPTMKIGYLTASKNHSILKNFPNLIDFYSQPIVNLSSLKKFNYVVHLDNTIESDIDSKICSLQEIYAKHLLTNITESSLNYIFENNQLFKNKHTRNGIGIQYKSNSIIRNYDIDKVSELVGLLTAKFPTEPIFLLDKANDYFNVEYILSKNTGNIIANGCGFKEHDIDGIINIVNNLKLVIGIDSSMLHIAGMCDIPSIGLFGPFPSDLRIRYYNNAIGIDGKTDCSPCFRHMPQAFCKINYGQGVCLNSISPQTIIDNIPENFI